MAVLMLAISMLLLTFASAALAGNSIGGFIGGTVGSTADFVGGSFNAPRDVALYEGTDGDPSTDKMFVVEGLGASNRIQRLDVDGNFERAWGKDVVRAGAPGDFGTGFEVCTVAQACKAAPTGDLKGEFNQPSGIAVDQQNGWVYVSDRGNRRVQKFDLDGNFLVMFGKGTNQTTGGDVCTDASDDVCGAGMIGTDAAQFGNNGQQIKLAVHPTTGDVFASDAINRRVLQFDSNGAFVRGWGFGVDTGDEQFQVCTTASGCAAALAAGTDNGRFGNNQPVYVTVDSNGIVYASDSNVNNRIIRFDSTLAPAAGDASAALLGPITTTTAPALISTATSGLAIDPSSGNLLTVRRMDTASPTVVQELEIPTPATDPVTTVIDTHTYAPQNHTQTGIAVSGGTGNIFLPISLAATSFPACACGTSGGLIVLTDGVAAPTMTALPALDPGPRDAVLQGTVDPNDGFTAYRLEYSSTGQTDDWTAAAADRYVSGSGELAISDAVDGLNPNTLYRVRAVGTTYTSLADRIDVISPETTFATDAIVPDAATVAASSLTDSSARLAGRVNPNGSATTYRFEYGTSSTYGNSVPVPAAPAGSGHGDQAVSELVGQLLPATTYHYRLCATSGVGNACGVDRTFTTKATAGGVSQGARGFELVSPADKVGGIGVGRWEFVGGFNDVTQSGFSSYEGERFAAQGDVGSVLVDGAHAFASDWALAERANDAVGWRSHSPLTYPSKTRQFASFLRMQAATPDLSKSAWRTNNFTPVFLPDMEVGGWGQINAPYVADWGPPSRWEIFGPTSVDPGDQLTPIPGGPDRVDLWDVVLSDDGSAAVGSTRLIATHGMASVVGMAGPGDPTHPDHGAPAGDLVAGRSVYLADLAGGLADSFAGTGPRELVNVCADETELPSVDGSGDLQAEVCPAPLAGRDARMVSERGATLQAANAGVGASQLARNVASEDGSRVFFMSPDPLATGVPNGSSAFCQSAGQVCPPQLYVRQRNDDGVVVTRWISRAEDGLFGTQAASLTGAVRFEGASADGGRVFFRTNSPLTTDDPNGTGSAPVTGGTASNDSWDLYMYELADGPDPMGPGAQLTRISAGPNGDGDCNGLQADDLAQPMSRFASDDGSRAYFVCSAPLPGVPDPANGTITSPGGTPQTANQANLYSYDGEAPEAERWRFVARLPRAVSGNWLAQLDACATTGTELRSPLHLSSAESGQIGVASGTNCVRGTSNGEFVTFWTRGQLTADDPDGVSADIYAYDAATDELTRITAAQGGPGGMYLCAPGPPLGDATSVDVPCHGDGGYDTASTLPFLGVATNPLVAGDRVAFFQSKSRLTPDDDNDEFDVYEWRNGELLLVTTGAPGAEPAYYRGNDASGRNVFFFSEERLTWQDHDAVSDIYTARVDGGIPPPPPPPVCDVLGGACHGGGAVLGGGGSIVSGAPGGGDAEPGARTQITIGAVGAGARRRAARRGVLPLAVRTTGAGRITAVARARVRVGRGRARTRRVARAVVNARSAGRTVMRLRLSPAARRHLRSGRALRLAVRVGMPGVRNRTATIRLRRPSR